MKQKILLETILYYFQHFAMLNPLLAVLKFYTSLASFNLDVLIVLAACRYTYNLYEFWVVFV